VDSKLTLTDIKLFDEEFAPCIVPKSQQGQIFLEIAFECWTKHSMRQNSVLAGLAAFGRWIGIKLHDNSAIAQLTCKASLQ
jgi:hypothetical protein